MSEFTDAVRSSLTDEWRSTREIASGIPMSRGIAEETHRMEVCRVLRRMERDGLAEGRVVRPGHGKGKEWRLKA